MLVEYVKENYYAMFHDPSYHRYREIHFSVLLDVKYDKVNLGSNVGQGYRVMVRACRVCQRQ